MHATFQHDGLTTRAHVESEFHEFTGDGVARCRPEDHYVQGLGERIAAGRAIQELGKKIEDHYLAASITEEQWKLQSVQGTDAAKTEAIVNTFAEAAAETQEISATPFEVSL